MTVTSNETIFGVGRHDATWWEGSVWGVGASGAGNTWQTTLKRYCRFLTATNTSASERYTSFMEPRGFLDQRYGSITGVMRLRDTLACLMSGGTAGNSHYGALLFGFVGSTLNGPPAGIPLQNGDPWAPFLGFRVHYSAALDVETSNDVNWRCYFVDDTLTQRHDFVTSVDSRNSHDLLLELDSETGTINWYIDGILVSTYTPASNEVSGQSASGYINGQFRLIYCITAQTPAGIGRNFVLARCMSAGMPMLSIEYTEET